MSETLLALILGAVAVGEIPRFHFNRATLALVGAVLVLAVGILPLETAFAAIDWNTLTLLFAMMVFTAHLRLAGSWLRSAILPGSSCSFCFSRAPSCRRFSSTTR